MVKYLHNLAHVTLDCSHIIYHKSTFIIYTISIYFRRKKIPLIYNTWKQRVEKDNFRDLKTYLLLNGLNGSEGANLTVTFGLPRETRLK